MYKLYPYFTNDGSAGLFSPEADDIYHSTYGALTEAYEKFILPANLKQYFLSHSQIKILDICFGIGYNTKSFLNYFFENIFGEKKFCKTKKILKNFYPNVSIHTNNIKYNDKIYTDNVPDKNELDTSMQTKEKKYKIYIKAIDTDKNLAFLSPFFVTGKKIRKNKLKFEHEKISAMLKETTDVRLKLNPLTNMILLLKIIENNPEILTDTEFIHILNDKNYSQFFDTNIKALFEFYQNKSGKYQHYSQLLRFLHNIYYRNISKRHKMALNTLKLLDFDFDLKIKDARRALLSDENKYDFVFLDAFTPAKCPILWTVDFFRLLFAHLDNDGMIMTYSNSAAVRNAFLTAGFYVGKIYSDVSGKFIGTVALKNKSRIEYELSEYELGLLKTKAGIFYRDENLTGENEAVIAAHENEAAQSDFVSSSKYIKSHKEKK